MAGFDFALRVCVLGDAPNMKSHINDMNNETARSHEKLQELVRELDKRIRKYEERGGKSSKEDKGSIMYTMIDESLKRDARRCKVVSDEKKLRDYIFNESSENRAISQSSRKRPGAMDVNNAQASW